MLRRCCVPRLHPPAAGRRRRGYTLTELMLALTIFALSSSAVSSLMFATYNTNRQVKGATDGTSQAEIALRRMIENVRSATDVLYTNPTTGLLVQTPPDSSSLSYIYIYYVQNGMLREKIQTAGSLTLVQDNVVVDKVSSFSVTQQTVSSPKSYKIDLTLGTIPPVTRSVVVTGRNL